MTDREIMQQALEALKKCRYRSLADEIVDPAITALNERLAQPEQEPVAWESFFKRYCPWLEQPEQEPVARVIDNGTPEGATEWIPFTNRVEPLKTGDLLYTAPPQRKPPTA